MPSSFTWLSLARVVETVEAAGRNLYRGQIPTNLVHESLAWIAEGARLECSSGFLSKSDSVAIALSTTFPELLAQMRSGLVADGDRDPLVARSFGDRVVRGLNRFTHKMNTATERVDEFNERVDARAAELEAGNRATAAAAATASAAREPVYNTGVRGGRMIDMPA